MQDSLELRSSSPSFCRFAHESCSYHQIAGLFCRFARASPGSSSNRPTIFFYFRAFQALSPVNFVFNRPFHGLFQHSRGFGRALRALSPRASIIFYQHAAQVDGWFGPFGPYHPPSLRLFARELKLPHSPPPRIWPEAILVLGVFAGLSPEGA